MLNANDKENVTASSLSANLLVQDLHELIKYGCPLLAEVAMEILQQAVQIEKRLKGIETAIYSK